MGVIKWAASLGLLVLAVLLTGCGAESAWHVTSPTAAAGGTVTASPLPVLPAPADLARTASAWNYTECHGADYLTGVVHNRIVTKGTLAGFDPHWRLHEHHPLEEAAYAVYALQVPGFAGESKVSLLWLGLPPAAQTCWVGLANQQKNRWDWLLLRDDSTVSPASLAPYTSEVQQIYVAVVLLGDAPRSLNGLWVGDGTHLYYEAEDNDSAETANPLPPLPFNQVELTGSVGSGYIDCYDGDNDDWFSFIVDEPSTLKLSFHTTGTYSGGLYFKYYQSDAAQQPQLISQGAVQTDSHLICPTTGKYWLELTSEAPVAIYSFSLALCDEKFTELEDNDTCQQANPIAASEDGFLPVSGCLSIPKDKTEDVDVYDGDHDDWFSFYIQDTPRAIINLVANTPYRGYTAMLYAADGFTQLESVNVSYNSSAEWHIELPSLGKYYLRLNCDKNSYYVSYFFSIVYGTDNHGWFNRRIDQGIPLDDSLYTNISEMVGFETDGQPELCWLNYENDALYYSRANGTSFTQWSKPQRICTFADSAWDIISSFKVDERPVIICSNRNRDTFGVPQYYYIIATDKSGERWNDPVGIKIANIDSFYALAFTQVQGSPALIGIYGFYSGAYDYRGAVFYSRADDAAGTNWSAANTIDLVWNTSAYCSMQIINGKPAAVFSCYYDSIYCFVRYVQANDELGNSWGDPLNIYEYIGPERVVLLNWLPTPTIYIKPEFLHYMPRGWFAQAVDADGKSWSAPYDTNLLIYDSDYECDTIFALVYSVPRAVWSTGGRLLYSYAEEYDGSKWAYAEVIDPIHADQEYMFHCIFDLKGQLGIAYVRDGLRFALRY